MKFSRLNLLIAFLLIHLLAPAQKLRKADREQLKKTEKSVLPGLQAHIGYLADDRLEGRRAGSPGEGLAMKYIADQFNQAGLAPKGTDGFFQPFDINEGLSVLPGSFFSINGDSLDLGKEYFPFPYSAQIKLEALPAIAIQELDMPWFVDLADILQDNQQNPHFDLPEYIRTNAIKAHDKGASAVIIYNTSALPDNLSFNAKDRTHALAIPVLYVFQAPAKKYFKDPTATLTLKMKIAIGEKKRVGHNVIGYLDNGAPNTVIIGGHFDHLGYGEDGNSMLRTGEHLIHNGADDNASGTAAVIELAKLIRAGKYQNSNFLFIAFSGEELGLFGSKYFTDHPTIELGTVNYMINLDMVGRLNDSTHALTIGGYGTSPAWAALINPKEKDLPFVITLDSSGSGPSDHTSFYRKDIPVLFFFTNAHKDYHRPTDDANLINYNGELNIIRYIYRVVGTINQSKERLTFLKTRETQTSTTSFKVTLGIMPDYTFTGTGVRADAVSDGRPAFKAGLKAGDIVIQLGDYKVNSLDDYMQALNKFNKGSKTKVKFKRGKETMDADIQF